MKDFGSKLLGGIKSLPGRFQYNAPVVLTYTLLSFLALLLDMATKGWATKSLFSVYRAPFDDPLTYFRFIGYALGHANFDHFFGNFLLILLAGPMLEEKYGSIRLLIMIGATALITGILHFIIDPSTMLLGASGVVFMLIILSSFVNLKSGKIPLTLVLCVAVFIGREVVANFTVADNISRLTHIFGGLLGAIFGLILNKNKLIEVPEKDGGEDKTGV